MDTVGILTYHDLKNFGAQLQAASLQNYISQLGYQTELIDFRPLRKEVRQVAQVARLTLQGRIRDAAETKGNYRKFRREIRNMAKLSSRRAYLGGTANNLANNYRTLVCGSDELWNFGNYLGYIPQYILDLETDASVRKISYAASLGSYQPSGETSEKMRRSLRNFNAILVRDDATKKFVDSLGLNCTQVLDPTFLINLSDVPLVGSGHIMISGAVPQQLVVRAKELSKRLGANLITPGYRYRGLEDCYVEATPKQWIGYISNARYHITSLFHGAALSIKYDTPFSVIVTEEKAQKVRSLLEQFELVGRSLQVQSVPDELDEQAETELPEMLEPIRARLVSRSQAALNLALERPT